MAAGVLVPFNVPLPVSRWSPASSPAAGRPASVPFHGRMPPLRISRPSPSMTSSFAGGAAAARRKSALCEAAEDSAVQSSGDSGLEHAGVPEVTASTWNSLVKESSGLVVVEFWAPWCGPCRTVEPIVTKLASDYRGRVECFKLNTDENPDVATQYEVRSIPTVMVFASGERKDAIIGAVPESTIVSCVEKCLSLYE